jgi:hypothetical protein
MMAEAHDSFLALRNHARLRDAFVQPLEGVNCRFLEYSPFFAQRDSAPATIHQGKPQFFFKLVYLISQN